LTIVHSTFEVNTLGLLWTIKTFLPSLVANNHGHLLIVASQTAFITSAGVTDYCASKAAALSIYEGVHSEMKHIYNAPAVRVSCISPSHVKTGMFTGIKSVPGMTSLTPESIAKTIGDILYSGFAHNIMIPKSAYASKLARIMPEWFRITAQDIAAGAFKTLTPHDPMAKSQ
jgi:short-subunit dehydrogenase